MILTSTRYRLGESRKIRYYGRDDECGVLHRSRPGGWPGGDAWWWREVPVQGGICHGLGSLCAVADRRPTDGITDCTRPLAPLFLAGTSLAKYLACASYRLVVCSYMDDVVLWLYTTVRTCDVVSQDSQPGATDDRSHLWLVLRFRPPLLLVVLFEDLLMICAS